MKAFHRLAATLAGLLAAGNLLASCDAGLPARAPAAVPVPIASSAPPENPGRRRPVLRSLEPCVPVTYERCFNALDDNCNGALDEGCGTPAGVVQFMIAWDAARADVDLEVTDPNGELIEAGRVSASGMLKGRDCPGRRHECGGTNLENVFLDGTKPPLLGLYRVRVSLENLAGEEPPVWVTLSLRLGSRRHAYEIGLFETEDAQELQLSL